MGSNINRLNFLNKSIDLNKVNSAISLYSGDNLNILPSNNKVSLNLWFKTEETLNKPILLFGSKEFYSLILEKINGKTHITFTIKNYESGGDSVYTSSIFFDYELNKWYNIGISLNKGNLNFYLNGTTYHNENLGIEELNLSSDTNKFEQDFRFYTMINPNTYSIDNKNIYVKNIAVFNDVLNLKEIKDIKNSYINIEDSRLLAFWPLSSGANVQEIKNKSYIEIDGETPTINYMNSQFGDLESYGYWKSDLPKIKAKTINPTYGVLNFISLYTSKLGNIDSYTIEDDTINNILNLQYGMYLFDNKSTTQQLNYTIQQNYIGKNKKSTFEQNLYKNKYSLSIKGNPNNYFIKEVNIKNKTNEYKITINETISGYKAYYLEDVAYGDYNIEIVTSSNTFIYNFQEDTLETSKTQDDANYLFSFTKENSKTYIKDLLIKAIAVTLNDNMKFNVNEGSKNIGTIKTKSTNHSEILSYSISNTIKGNSDIFEISKDGLISVKTNASLSFQENQIHQFNVYAINSAGNSNESTITINIIPSVHQLNDMNFEIKTDAAVKTTILGGIDIKTQGYTSLDKYILEGEGSEYFTFNIYNKLILNKSLDTYGKSKFNLNIKAVDTNKNESEYANIFIQILNTDGTAKNIAPTINNFRDIYLNKNFLDKSLTLDINDIDEDNVNMTFDYNPKNIINISSASSNTLQISSILGQIGTTKITFTLNDGSNTLIKELNIHVKDNIVLDTFKEKLSLDDYENLISSNINLNKKYFSIKNNFENSNKMLYTSFDFLDNNKVIRTKYINRNDKIEKRVKEHYFYSVYNNLISIYETNNFTNKIFDIKVQALSKDKITNNLNKIETSLDFEENDIYNFYIKSYINKLDINEEVKHNNQNFFDFNSLIQVYSNNKTPILKSKDHKKVLYFNENDFNSQEGFLYEYNLFTNEVKQTTSKWKYTKVDNKDLIVFEDLSNDYDSSFALVLINKIYNAEYIKNNTINKELFLTRESNKKFKEAKSSNPKISKTLNSSWNYISFEGKTDLCDITIQMYVDSCDKTNSLNSVFSDDNILYLLKYDGNAWSYWDNDSELKASYSLNKFTHISQNEGLLIKLKNSTTINLPFNDIDEIDENFIKDYSEGWHLISFDKKKTKEEINELFDKNNKILETLLLLKNNNQWKVYSPNNNQIVNDELERLNSEILESESFWVYIKNKE